jgi:hypothetical protein
MPIPYAFFLTLFLSLNSLAQLAKGDVIGTVLDQTGDPVFDIHVYIDDTISTIRYQAKSGEDGKFRISGIPAGEYNLVVRQFEDTLKGILVNIPRDGFHNCGTITFIQNRTVCTFPMPRKYFIRPNFNFEYFEIRETEIQESAVRFELKKLVESRSSEIQLIEQSRDLSIQGSQVEDVLYLIDGVKLRGNASIPSVAVNEIKVYTGGIPARYGDTNGGVVSIETKGYFDLYEDWILKNNPPHYFSYY